MLIVFLIVAVLFSQQETLAQAQSSRVFRIGFLSSLAPGAITDRLDAFRKGLQELGYAEGKNVRIEARHADGQIDRLPSLAAGLVRLKVDVIVTGGPAVNKFAKEATSTIPVVMSFDNDPVGNGFVTSLAQPGGNITGLSTQYPEISGKQIELMKEIVPKLSRLATIGNSSMSGNEQALRETERAANAFGLRVKYFDVQKPSEIQAAFRSAAKEHADAAIVLGSQVVTSHAAQFAEMAAKCSVTDNLLEPRIRAVRRSC